MIPIQLLGQMLLLRLKSSALNLSKTINLKKMAEHTKRKGSDKRTAKRHAKGQKTKTNANKRNTKPGWKPKGGSAKRKGGTR